MTAAGDKGLPFFICCEWAVQVDVQSIFSGVLSPGNAGLLLCCSVAKWQH
jgi:hypothetical protein